MAALFLAGAALAQTFPQLTGRVVDGANLLSPPDEAGLNDKLTAFERRSGRQFVVATVRSLEGRTIEDYGYRLGRTWGIGDKDKDDGVILLVAPAEKKVRIETGYGARVVLTDAISSVIVREAILPAFQANDYTRGISQGADQIMQTLELSPAEAQRRATDTSAREAQVQRGRQSGGSILPLLFWGAVLFFVVLPMLRGMGGGGRRHRRRGFGGPVILWGPGFGGGGFGGGGFGGGGFGGGGFGGGGFGGGGFSGGGGSFGGGGASGGW